MKKLSISIFLLFAISIGYGQRITKLDKDTSKYKNASIMLINLGHDSVLRVQARVINNNSVDSCKVERKKKFVKLYGKKADKGVSTIYLTPGTILLNTHQLLKCFNIEQINYNLPIYIDSAIDTHSTTTYFQLSAIKYVKIEKEAKTNKQYISIRSMYPIFKRLPFNTDLYVNATYTIPETE